MILFYYLSSVLRSLEKYSIFIVSKVSRDLLSIVSFFESKYTYVVLTVALATLVG